MAFFHRAKSMYDRGEVVRAATILAEGLKREPTNVEALEWLLHLYVKEIPNPGLEIEVIKILAAQGNGLDLLELVQDELEAARLFDKIKALDNVRRREGLLLELPHPSAGKGSKGPAFPRSADAASHSEPDEDHEDHEGHEDDKVAFAAFMSAAKGGAQTQEQTSESWKSFADPTDEIAQLQARTPAARKTPLPSPAIADRGVDRSASRTTRPLPPLDDASDERDDEGDGGVPDAPRPVMAWVMVGVATALLALALVMAFMRNAEAPVVLPAPSESDGSGGAHLWPVSTSWSNA